MSERDSQQHRQHVDEPPIRAVVEPVFSTPPPPIPSEERRAESGEPDAHAPQQGPPAAPRPAAPAGTSPGGDSQERPISAPPPLHVPYDGERRAESGGPDAHAPPHVPPLHPRGAAGFTAAQAAIGTRDAHGAANVPPPNIIPVPTSPQRNRPGRRPPPLPSVKNIDAEPFEQRRMARLLDFGLWLGGLLDDMPAWFVSLVFHLALMIILGLFHVDVHNGETRLVITASFADAKKPGDQATIVAEKPDPPKPDPPKPDPPPDKPKEPEHGQDVADLPVPEQFQPKTDEDRKAIKKAEQDAAALEIDPSTQGPQMPALKTVASRILAADPRTSMTAARDPRLRVELVRSQGGTLMTEAAVARGLQWLAAHQSDNGSWSLTHFNKAGDCDGRCKDTGTIESDPAATSLALLAFLGAGQTPAVGIYQQQVAKGLDWLLANQQKNGDLSKGSGGNAQMYAHALATMTLSEAYAMTQDERFREPAQRGVDFIVKAQNRAGGWRYHPKEAGDTSVLGWQLMALQSAKSAQLDVPQKAFDGAARFLTSVQSENGARYSYQRKKPQTEVMTAEGLLCRIYLGWDRQQPALDDGVKFLIDNHLPDASKPNIYYWYYGSQLMHHYGGEAWTKWNDRMRDILVARQATEGHEAGSWPPSDKNAKTGGRLYETALSTCSLEVYYRHLPIFHRIDLGESE